MRIVSDRFKEILKTNGREFDFKLLINNEEENQDNLFSIRYNYNSSLFKTIMQGIEIESKKDYKINSSFDLSVGVKLDDEPYEYINYTKFYCYSSEKLEDYNSYKVIAYDKILESMIPYDLKVNYPISIRDYLVAIYNRLNWDITGIPTNFINSSKIIYNDVHSNIDYTFRDVLDEICTITGAFLIVKNDIPTLCYPNNTFEEIDESYLNEDNVTINEKCFFNSLVFSRVLDSDSIYRKNNESIEINGLKEFKISDNQILSTDNRSDFIDELWEYLKNFEFYIFDVDSIGILFLEPIDCFEFKINGSSYSTLILNNEVTFDDGLYEILYSSKSNETETDYKYSTNDNKKDRQTYILIDKQNQEIKALSTKIVPLSNIITGTSQITLKNAYEGILNHLSIKGQMSLIFPSKNLYPSRNLFTKNSKITIDDTEYNLNINYLNYIDADVCDEYVNDNGKSKIIRRVGVNSDGSFYALGSEYIEYLDDVTLNIKSNSVIKMNCFDNVILKATYLLQNDITDTFTTHAEVKAELKIASDNINSEVSKKTDKDKIISTINQSAEQVKIDANKIVLTANDILNLLAGNTINLGSKNITIASDNFNVDINGNAIMNNATMNNAMMNSATMNNANIIGGNMTLSDGANIVSDKGLLTNLIYPAFTRGSMFNGSGDYLPLGHVGGGDTPITQRNALVFAFKLPNNFTIKSAKVHLIHAPISWKHDNTTTIGYSRNLNLYRINSTSLEIDAFNYYAPYSTNYSLIPNALNFTGSSNGITFSASTDITSEISTTSYNQFAVLTSDETVYNGNTEIFGRSGGVVGYLEIIGYTNFK